MELKFFLNESIFFKNNIVWTCFWQLLWSKLVSSLALYHDQMTEYSVIHTSKSFFLIVIVLFIASFNS